MVSNEGATIFFIAARAKKGPGEHWDVFFTTPLEPLHCYKRSRTPRSVGDPLGLSWATLGFPLGSPRVPWDPMRFHGSSMRSHAVPNGRCVAWARSLRSPLSFTTRRSRTSMREPKPTGWANREFQRALISSLDEVLEYPLGCSSPRGFCCSVPWGTVGSLRIPWGVRPPGVLLYRTLSFRPGAATGRTDEGARRRSEGAVYSLIPYTLYHIPYTIYRTTVKTVRP